MPFLVRKIMRQSNVNSITNCSKEKILDITADVTTNEFRTSEGKLSVWLIDSLDELDKAVLAIAMSGQKIEDFKIAVINFDNIKNAFELDESPGITAVTSLACMHRDICGITHSSLEVLLKAYKDAADDGRCIRYKTKEIKRLTKNALIDKQIDIEAVETTNERLAEQLKELLDS